MGVNAEKLGRFVFFPCFLSRKQCEGGGRAFFDSFIGGEEKKSPKEMSAREETKKYDDGLLPPFSPGSQFPTTLWFCFLYKRPGFFNVQFNTYML